ncbi:hypothetical protein GQ44DRAFT_727193 [Phaeosphaeriaceae sp. PMI808]|nr:hypothetical protein GQ44DRAFT_727193 [Phaeosphaeriaceae sp. PMI808]
MSPTAFTPASPRTPTTARKAPHIITPLKSHSYQKSHMATGQKRKFKPGVTSPLCAFPTNNGKSGGAPTSKPFMTPKKQKTTPRKNNNITNEVFPPFPPRSNLFQTVNTPSLSQSPHTVSPMGQQQQPQATPPVVSSGISENMGVEVNTNIFHRVISTVLLLHPTALPTSQSEVITSNQIDDITYKTWDYCITRDQGQLLLCASQYGAMFGDIKLRVLAKLNYLPSWWFMRMVVYDWLLKIGRLVDDSHMTLVWNHATIGVAEIARKTEQILKQMSSKTTKEETS